MNNIFLLTVLISSIDIKLVYTLHSLILFWKMLMVGRWLYSFQSLLQPNSQLANTR